MLRTLLVAGTVGLAAALPAPQDIEFAALNALPSPSQLGAPVAASVASEVPTYAPSVAAAEAAAAVSASPIASSSNKRAVEARNACDPRPSGQGVPQTSPDTPDAFVNNVQYRNLAVDSFAPQGYVRNFTNLSAATQQDGYLGYYTLNGYDTIGCRQHCDATATCTAFNVYIERDPSVEPGAGCENPASSALIKCSLYGLPINAATAINDGQWQADFDVVIAGSNGM